MFMTNSNDKDGELLGQERRRRWSTDQKLAMVRESLEPGQSVSMVARRNRYHERNSINHDVHCEVDANAFISPNDGPL